MIHCFDDICEKQNVVVLGKLLVVANVLMARKSINIDLNKGNEFFSVLLL
jgi:hypothetical protein